jgi:hypothetical protein
MGAFAVVPTDRAFGCPVALHHTLPVPETGLKPPCPERGGFSLSPRSHAIWIAAAIPDLVR